MSELNYCVVIQEIVISKGSGERRDRFKCLDFFHEGATKEDLCLHRSRHRRPCAFYKDHVLSEQR